MNALWFDLRNAARLLFRRPGLTLIAVVSLGLGIGASTAIFSLVDTVLLRPLPYPEADRLVEAFRIDKAVTGLNPTVERVSGLFAVPYEVHRDWMEAGPVFTAGRGYAGTRVTLLEGDGSSSLLATRMTSGAFRALGIQLEAGRAFLPEDDRVGAPPVAVLSYGLWQGQFGGDPGVVGRQINLDGTAHTVTGVMPRDFSFPDDVYRLWLSFTDAQKTSPTRNAGYLKVVARLAPGITLEQARREMAQVGTRIGELHPEEAEQSIGLFPLKAIVVGGSGTGLLVLLGAVTLVLLIACTNMAGLFLVRATERRREIGVRLALGAESRRVVFQHLSESLLLALLGGAVGWGLAAVGLKPLLSLMPGELPRLHELRLDQGLLFTAIGFALFTGVLTGIVPALQAAGTPVTSVLREGGRSLAGGRSRSRTQGTLVVAQVALAFVLLTGAGLFIRTMTGLLAVDPGFRTRNIAVANVSFPAGAGDINEAQFYFRTLEDRIRALPGVEDVGAADQMPFSGGLSAPPVSVETTAGLWEGILHFPTVTPSYFSTMGIPVLSGRGLSPDDSPDTDLVVVVSQAQAERMAPDGSPLGLRIRLNAPGADQWRTVVGVVGNVKYGLDWEAMAQAYVPLAQAPDFMDNWVIRTAGDPLDVAAAFQELREELDPEGTSVVRDLESLVYGSRAVVAARFSLVLLGGLAGLAALLAVFGVYGVLAYLVQLRSKEIGIQLALGAEKGTVLGTVLRSGFMMAGFGLGLGILMALGLGRFLASQLFGVEPSDPATLAGAGLLLLGATLVASYLPARRAAGLDPVEVLRRE